LAAARDTLNRTGLRTVKREPDSSPVVVDFRLRPDHLDTFAFPQVTDNGEAKGPPIARFRRAGV
jgi:hypothetical protein